MPDPFKRGPLPKAAIEFLLKKKIKPSFSYRDVWSEEHAYAFTVAGILERDVLEDVKASLDQALAAGIPFGEWARGIRETLDKSGWSDYGKTRPEPHRMRTIYETNMRTAHAQGQWERAQTTVRTHPYFLLSLGPSTKHRDEHVTLAGTLLPQDDPFWDTHIPPMAYGCKCRIRQVSKGEAARLGGVTPSPDDPVVEWTDKKTGATFESPRSVHPSFAYHKGTGRKAALDAARTPRDWQKK